MSASASLEAVRPAPVAVPSGRVPPQNLDAERSVLGGVLLDNAALNEILEFLKPQDFYRDAHRKVFEAMCALSSRGEPIDRVTLKDELTALGAYETVGGEDFIDLLDKLVPSAANLAYYAKIVHEKAIARRVIEAAHAIASQGYEQAGEVAEFLDDAERRIFAITEEKAQSAFQHVREIVKSTSCSRRHSTHHVPHTLSTNGLPRKSCGDTFLAGSSTVLSENVGALLPMSGEGT